MRCSGMRIARTLGLLVLLTPLAARADVAPPPLEEMSCPRGAIAILPEVEEGATDPLGRPLRPWPVCVPTRCASDADCDGGRTCAPEEIGMCLEEVEGQTHPRIRPRGCEPDGTCLNNDSTCDRARRCVEPDGEPPPIGEPTDPATEPATEPAVEAEEPPAAAQSAGCGCRSAGPAPTLPWLMLGAFGWLIARAGRRRSVSRG